MGTPFRKKCEVESDFPVGIEHSLCYDGSLYAIESISKLPKLLSRYCTTSSLRTVLRYFQDTYLHDHSGLPLPQPYLHHWGNHQWPLQNLFHPLHPRSGISCPPIFPLPRHCLFLEGISSTICSLMHTLASLHQPSKLRVSHRPPNAFQPSAYD